MNKYIGVYSLSAFYKKKNIYIYRITNTSKNTNEFSITKSINRIISLV